MELKLKLEDQIQSLIKKDNQCSVHFEYDETDFIKTATAYTINPKNDTTFLLKTEVGNSIEEALEKIYQHVRILHEKSPFVVNWIGPKQHIMQISYFYLHDMLEVAQAFYKDKNRADYVILKCELLPIS